MFRSMLAVVFMFSTPIAAVAQNWCATQETLFESVAAMVNPDADPLVMLVGPQTELLLVVGEIDEKSRFSGQLIGWNGSETPIELQINPGAPAVYAVMSRIPPSILSRPKPSERFVGLAGLDLPWPPGSEVDAQQYLIHRTECAEGYVTNPTADDIAQLKICVTTGQCGS